MTYSQVAKSVGLGSARVVGNILHKNPDISNCPCFRVVDRHGRIADRYAFGGSKGQKELLQEDGVEITDGKVDLNKYFIREIRNN
jgi:alkylated DNA nucleotide flippase Atl1